MAQAAGLGLAGLSALSGMNANNQAAGAASAAQKSQQSLIARQTQAFDALYGAVTGEDKAGAFDPTKAVNQLSNDTAYYESRDGGNTAGSDRVAGYQAGDTPETQALDDVKVKYRQQFNQQAQAIRDSKLQQKLGAYSSLLGGAGALNAGIGAEGQQQQLDYSRMQNPGGLFGSISPFLAPTSGGSSSPPWWSAGAAGPGGLPKTSG